MKPIDRVNRVGAVIHLKIGLLRPILRKHHYPLKEDVLKKGTLAAAVLVGAVATLAVAATGFGKQALTPLPSSSCSSIQGPSDAQFLIASDLPLQGAGRTQTIQMTQAINFVLKSHGYKAGSHTIAYQSCDDATAQAGKWDSGKVSANANAYARNAAVVGVIGTFNSGAAEIMIPILNRAPNGPIAMVSPANTYVGLTHAGPGTAAGEPDKYYPTRKRNYVRVVAADDFQGAADAILAKDVLKSKKIYILNDKEAYGLGVATNLKNALAKIGGVKVVGFEAWDGKASSYEALANKIKAKGADSVFLGGLVCENGGKLVKDLRAGLGTKVHIMAPDGFTPISAVVDGAGGAANGVTVSVAGLPNNALKGAGKSFLSSFSKVVKKQADPYAVYAAQAAEVMYQAILKSDGSRASVASNLFKTKVSNGILGTFSINANGDTTSNPVTIYKIAGGQSTTYKVITPPTSVVKSS
jgi:branched-chain amino acid transport system substrate-binding protein